ncbi:ATP-binding protein [Streptomonospora wellingtoniae]|uniref:ATP-binding protein n=1 Tax=Streptomonospora wellingtoniae TaxID=3075544 RepID=UPI0037DA2A97
MPAARGWIAHTLAPADRIDDVVLAADELLTNALQHAPRPRRAGDMVAMLAVEETATAHVVQVWSRRSKATVPAPRCPALEAEHGRGLALVAAVADDWGWAPADGWVAVWARFATGGGRR